jgi:Transposase, Mutator family
VVDATMDGLSWLRKQVEEADTDLLREMVKLLRAADGRGASLRPGRPRVLRPGCLDAARRGLVRHLGIERISKSRVSQMAKELDTVVEAFRSRPLDGGPCTYVWLGALTRKVREGGRPSTPRASSSRPRSGTRS